MAKAISLAAHLLNWPRSGGLFFVRHKPRRRALVPGVQRDTRKAANAHQRPPQARGEAFCLPTVSRIASSKQKALAVPS